MSTEESLVCSEFIRRLSTEGDRQVKARGITKEQAMINVLCAYLGTLVDHGELPGITADGDTE